MDCNTDLALSLARSSDGAEYVLCRKDGGAAYFNAVSISVTSKNLTPNGTSSTAKFSLTCHNECSYCQSR